MKKRKKVARDDRVEVELRMPRETWTVYQAVSQMTGYPVNDIICIALAVSIAATQAKRS